VILTHRAFNLWLLGYPDAALRDTDNALRNGREIGQAASLMSALYFVARLHILCGNYSVAIALSRELSALAGEKGAPHWMAYGILSEAWILVLTGKPSDAVRLITSGLSAYRPTGGTVYWPLFLSHLAKAYADLSQFDDAWRCYNEVTTAIETTKERWYEAETHRIAGEIALMSPERDKAKAEKYFDRALSVARQQQAKSLELRATMSLARLWHDQGKVQQACELLAPVYGWFTEGFDTLDLKEAKALLEELAA
jgi:predicted ATPase